jgi:hydroxymethylbilane synthase
MSFDESSDWMTSMTERVLRIVSRKSRLALWQTNRVADLIRAAHPDVTTEVVTMDTTGDKIRDKPLPKIGGKGLFTRELEEALLADEVELAVHSLKDLPTSLPDGLAYAGSPQRATPTDCLVSTRWESFEQLPDDATIATGSVRRRAQLWSKRPNLRFEELRGNIDTRLRKLDENGWDAIVMATAALRRMGRDELVTAELPPEQFVPAVSQGAIGIEIREGRDDVAELLADVFDEATVTAVRGERQFMKRLEGGCSVPVAAHCRGVDEGWEFHGWVGSLDGKRVLHDVRVGSDPVAMADAMADDFIERGAQEILGR